MLYIISTPIGNLKDMSDRVKDTLLSVRNIICEDTRRTRILLESLGIDIKSKKLHVANDFSEKKLLDSIDTGSDYALVTDNGTPGISDPGSLLVNHFRNAGIPITHIPGPTAFVSALVLSGFDTEHFSFYGFLPKGESQIVDVISDLLPRKETLIFYESPHRIEKTLKIIDSHFPDLRVCVARELTKRFEEVIIGTAGEILSRKKEILGEIVLLVDAKDNDSSGNDDITDDMIRSVYSSFIREKIEKKDAIAKASALLKASRQRVYDLVKKK